MLITRIEIIYYLVLQLSLQLTTGSLLVFILVHKSESELNFYGEKRNELLFHDKESWEYISKKLLE